jgi:glucose-6-phosphate 1-dehydrogenase
MSDVAASAPAPAPTGPSDALVLYGFTGDLARKKIFPALHALVCDGALSMPVIGVSGSRLTDAQARERVRASIEEADPAADRPALERLLGQIRYVGGDYRDDATFATLRRALGGAKAPAHYLAVPPALFDTVIAGLARAGLNRDARLIVEKPFGRDLASARALDAAARAAFDEPSIFRIDHYLGKEAIMNLLYFRFANTFLQPVWCRDCVASVQVTMAERGGVGTRGGFYESVGALRDVVENHLFQIVALLAMEAPATRGYDDVQAAKIAVFRAMRPLRPDDLVRGQYAGYRQEKDVAPASDVETYCALRLQIDTPRWRGTPWYLRAGKGLATDVVEVQVRLKPPAHALFEDSDDAAAHPNALRLRLQPGEAIALSARVKRPGKRFVGERRELLLREDTSGEALPYERLLGDALAGDATLFTSGAAVEAAWAVVDPVLRAHPRALPYERGSWGPREADALVVEPGGWIDPQPRAPDCGPSPGPGDPAPAVTARG